MPFPKLANSWVVETMIASHNHIYKTVYNAQYFDLGPIGVSDYGTAPIASYQLEFLAMDENAETVAQAIQNYEINGRKYVLDVFHTQPSARGIREQYDEYGYELIRTGPILGYDIPNPVRGEVLMVTKIETRDQLDKVNLALYLENENIPLETLEDPHIHNFYAEWNGRVAGWVQLITIYPGAGYINQLYTMTDYRNKQVGTSLMARAHVECTKLGVSRMALVSSDMALGLYRRFGYRPLAYFTALRLKEAPLPADAMTIPLT
jgi:ribosomal protein S18 acetylase RimI-like enzyme